MSWAGVAGHDAVAATVRAAWERGRLAHAYLLVGPPGVGKRLFAGALAKTILCERRGEQFTPCGDCAACHLCDADTHPDSFSVRRPDDSTIVPIDLMRKLAENLSLKPARGQCKVAVIDDADEMDDAGANCFLKTLEEPPPGSLLLLIATAAELVLPTIRSRCQVLRFAPLAAELVADVLRANGITDPVQLEELPRLAEGSPGTALALADEDLWAFRRQLRDILGMPKPDTVGLAKAWQKYCEGAEKEGAVQRRRAGHALRLFVGFLRDALAETSEEGRRFAERVGTDAVLQMLERALDAEMHIDRKVQLVLILEALADAFHTG